MCVLMHVDIHIAASLSVFICRFMCTSATQHHVMCYDNVFVTLHLTVMKNKDNTTRLGVM